MTSAVTFISIDWLSRTGIVSAAVLALTALALPRVRGPAYQQRLAEWGLLCTLLVPVLLLFPGWLPILPSHGQEAITSEHATARGSAPDTGSAPGTTLDPAEPPCKEWAASELDLQQLLVQSREPLEGVTGSAADTSGQDAPDMPAPIQPIEWHPSVVSVSGVGGDSTAAGRYVGWVYAVVSVYGAIAAALGMRLAVGYWALHRLRMTSRQAPASVRALVQQLVGQERTPEVRVHRYVTLPISFGLWRPVIILPYRLTRRRASRELSWTVRHESAHLARRDPWSVLLVALAQMFCYWVPWFWWIKKQIGLCREYVADAMACTGSKPEDYAEFLIQWANRSSRRLWRTCPELGVAGRPSDLERRITMLLQHGPSSVSKRGFWTWAVGLLACTAVLAGVTCAESAPPGEQKGTSQEAMGQSQTTATKDRPEQVDKVPDKKPGDPAKDRAKDKEKPEKKHAGDETERALREQIEAIRKELEHHKAIIESARKQLEAMQRTMHDERLRQSLEHALRVLRHMEIDMDVRRGLQPSFDFDIQWGDRAQKPFPVPGRRSRLGVSVAEPDATLSAQLRLPKNQGLVVMEVLPGTPADKGGLKPHDILLKFGGKEVPRDIAAFQRMVREMPADQSLDIEVLREGQKVVLKDIKLPQLEEPEGRKTLRFRPLPPGPPPVIVPFGPMRLGAWRTIQIQRSDGSFHARDQEGNTWIEISGALQDGKAKPEAIRIFDGTHVNKYDALDKVPEAHRDKVQRLLKMVEEGSVQIGPEKKDKEKDQPAPKDSKGKIKGEIALN